MGLIRLDKFLADAGIGTRSQVKVILKKGQVTLNGSVVKKGDEKIDTARDVVCYLGDTVGYEEFRYFMLHKPAGVVTATEDKIDMTVMDLLKGENLKDLFPVGRLDKDTEGLLLITNDGPLSHRLLSPKHHVEKTYYLLADGIVTDEDAKKLEEGVDIGDEKLTLPAKVNIIKTENAKAFAVLDPDSLDQQKFDGNDEKIVTEMTLTICEGRFHQVKRMLEAVGKPVLYLKRLSMGSLELDENLEKGAYRRLTEDEISGLKLGKLN